MVITRNMPDFLGLRFRQHCQFQNFVFCFHVIFDPLTCEKNYPTSVISEYDF